MRISIGDRTRDAMKVLDINSYPFSSEELSSKFRQLIKLHHPDKNKGLHNDKAITIINAYKHLKNLVISFLVKNDEIEATKKMFDEDEDIFSIWDTCPKCKGLCKIKHTSFITEFISCPDCDPLPKRNKIREIIEDALCKDLKVNLGLDYFGSLRERLKRVLYSSEIRIPTYFPQFDEFINSGLPPYTLSVAVSRIHGWKSSFISNISARQVLNGKNVVLLTMEMSTDAFAQRFDSIFTLLDINQIYTIKKTRARFQKRIKEVKGREGIGKLFIEQFPTGEATVLDFKRYLRELQMRDINFDIIYVDYMNLMKPSYKSKGDMYSDVKKISEELRALSYNFTVPVFSVSQLNREGSNIPLESLDFIYIAESLGIAATSDLVVIFGDDEDKRVYESELFYKISKNRLGGRVGEINKFFYDSRSLKMYDSTPMETEMWKNDAEISGDDRNWSEISEPEPPRRNRRQH